MLSFTISRMNSLKSIQLLICMLVFLTSCCKGFKDPCKSEDRDIHQLCEQALTTNTTDWFTYIKIYEVEDEIQKSLKRIQNKYQTEDSLSDTNRYLNFGSPLHGQLIDSLPSKDEHSEYWNAEILSEVSNNIKNKYCLKHGLSDTQCAKDLSNVKLSRTSLGEMCFSKYYNEPACIKKNLNYRSLDGTCNNLKRSIVGKATMPYKRLLFPTYTDGIREISEELPNPRKLSTNLVNDKQSPDDRKSIAMAYWTIFIGHDLSHTAISKMGTNTTLVNCCFNDGIVQNILNKHIESCKPIIIPDDDTFFKSKSQRCMNYVRSVSVMRSDCTFGPMEQMNQVTHYLDGSMIYGSSTEQMWSLRTKSHGLLLTNTNGNNNKSDSNSSIAYLPLEDKKSNACQYGYSSCYRTGEIRANALPQLTVMHTLWVREHNRLAKALSYYNRHWTDERLFQEARKIVIASIQHITYTEWLPALLGKNYIKTNGLEMLKEGFSDAYNETTDPTVSNSFATAILPFANSMLSENISLYSEIRLINGSLSLKEHYNRPIESVMNYMDQLVRGLSTQNAQKVDMLFTQTLTNYLYSTHPDNLFGMDIVSLDIQRSRDHGIPSYTAFRKYCGLKDIKNVQDLSQIMVKGSAEKLMKQYKTWNDIDLLIGALLEKHIEDAMVGPTMGCIIKDQFIRTRTADRYFFDLPGVFNKDQLEQIRNVTLARVFCDNGNDVKTMQKQAFVKPASSDELLPCYSQLIPKIDLTLWLEMAETVE